MALIKMALLLLLFVIQLSHTIVQSEKALAGTVSNPFASCSANWLFTNDTVTNISATSINGVSIKYDQLYISNTNGYHEGLYKCSSDHSKAVDLTVYAVPQFQSFGTYVVPDGQSAVLNISLDYVNGGARGAKQNIYAVKLKKGGIPLLFCRTDGGDCTVKKSFIQNYTQIDTASNFTASMRTSNVNISDNGTYEAIVELNDIKSGSTITQSTSTFDLSVMTATSSTITTSSIVSETSVMTSILPSSTMIAESSLSPSSTTPLTSSQTLSSSSQEETQTQSTLVSITATTTVATTPSSTSDFTSNFLDEKSIIVIAVLIMIIFLSLLVIGFILLLCLYQRRRRSLHYSGNVIKMFNPTSQGRGDDVERPNRDNGKEDKRSYCSEAGESAASQSPNFLYDTIPAFVLTLGPGNSKIARV